jgi:hypothetical protein
MKKKKTTKKKGGAGKRKLLKTARKDASAFLTSEEGKMVKKDIVKMALAMGLTAAALGTAEAGTSHSNTLPTAHVDSASSHSDGITQTLHNDGSSAGHSSSHSNQPATHGNVAATSHGDHSSHSNHSSGGWC